LSKPWDDEESRAVVKDAFQRFGGQKYQWGIGELALLIE